jgi:tetratricopeptide (TPR) repeat protein
MASSPSDTQSDKPQAQTEESEKTLGESRVDIIGAIKTPLAFFALVVLVVEAIMGLAVGATAGFDRTLLIAGMISLIFLLVAVVALIAYFRPISLYAYKPESVTALSSKPMESFLDAEGYQILCAAYDERKNSGRLQKCAEAALARDKKDANGWYYLGRAYEGVSNFNQAISCFKKSLELGGPASPSWAWCALAWIYNQKGDFKLAEESAKKAVALDETYGYAWRELEHASEKLGKVKQAQEAAAKASAAGA